MDADTQAAIAAQSGQPSQETATEETNNPTPEETAAQQAADAQAKAAADQKAADEAAAAAAATKETPPVKDQGSEESAESELNMDEVKPPSQEEVDKALEEAGFSNEALGKELVENDGKLTSETVAALKEKFGETAVDNAVKDMEAQFASQKSHCRS